VGWVIRWDPLARWHCEGAIRFCWWSKNRMPEPASTYSAKPTTPLAR